ncbi:Peptidoglycan-associated lipoprotein [subsurface metagenome]
MIIAIAKVRQQRIEQPPALIIPDAEESRQITEQPPALKTEAAEKDFSAEPAEEESEAVPPARLAYQALSAAVYFSADSNYLSPATRESLEQILPEILAKPSRPVRIEGHCALYGSEAGRAMLSLQRAKNVAGFLRKKGWQPQIEPTIVGLGAREPITLDKEKQYLNRRVEISY